MTYTVVMIPSAARTRVLLMEGPDELLRALLPSPSQLQHERAVITFLESLALWLNAKLHVVLSVDATEAGCCLGLTDELGVGIRSLFFDIEGTRRARSTASAPPLPSPSPDGSGQAEAHSTTKS